MFFISPIKTLYSIKFYLQTLKEPLWKAFCFIIYLFVLCSIFLALYVPVKLRPTLNEGVEKVANYVPNIKISNGVINANDNKKLVISPKELQGYKIIFDTASTEPAYPTQMQKENIAVYVNKNTVYALFNGQFQQNVVQPNMQMEVSKEIVLKNKQQIVRYLSWVLIFVSVFALAFRTFMFTIFALIIAFIINAATKANLGFKKLLTFALYLQGPVLILDLILLVLPLHILGMSAFIALLIFVVYLNLIFLRHRTTLMQKVNTTLDEDEE